MNFKKTFIIFLIAFILLNLTIIFATNKNNNNISNYFRIHVVANSDSIDDQLLKYNMAKDLEKYISKLTLNCKTKEESKQIIENNMQNILSLCNSIISEKGYNYELKAYVGKLEYDEKHKDDLFMSAGVYDSLKIIIGNGNGNNWWSLIYPTSITSDTQQEEYDLNEIEYKLYIVEWFKELFNNSSL